MIARGQTWTHRVDGTHGIVIAVDEASVEAVIIVAPDDWIRARFDRHAFIELYEFTP